MEKFKFEDVLKELELAADNAKIKPSTRKSIIMIQEIREKLGDNDLSDEEYDDMKQQIADLDTRICDMLEMQFDVVYKKKEKDKEENKKKEEEDRKKKEAEAKRKEEEDRKKKEAEAKRKEEDQKKEEEQAKRREELRKKEKERIEAANKKKEQGGGETISSKVLKALNEDGLIHYKKLSEIVGRTVSAPRVQIGKLVLDNEPYTDYYRAVNAEQLAS